MSVSLVLSLENMDPGVLTVEKRTALLEFELPNERDETHNVWTLVDVVEETALEETVFGVEGTGNHLRGLLHLI